MTIRLTPEESEEVLNAIPSYVNALDMDHVDAQNIANAVAPMVAERIAQMIEAEADRLDVFGGPWAAENSMHRKAGWDAGMTTAARLARETGRG